MIDGSKQEASMNVVFLGKIKKSTEVNTCTLKLTNTFISRSKNVCLG